MRMLQSTRRAGVCILLRWAWRGGFQAHFGPKKTCLSTPPHIKPPGGTGVFLNNFLYEYILLSCNLYCCRAAFPESPAVCVTPAGFSERLRLQGRAVCLRPWQFRGRTRPSAEEDQGRHGTSLAAVCFPARSAAVLQILFPDSMLSAHVLFRLHHAGLLAFDEDLRMPYLSRVSICPDTPLNVFFHSHGQAGLTPCSACLRGRHEPAARFFL